MVKETKIGRESQIPCQGKKGRYRTRETARERERERMSDTDGEGKLEEYYYEEIGK